MYVTYEEAVKQLQIDLYTDEEIALDPTLKDEKDYIERLILVAEQSISNNINCDISEYSDLGYETPTLPEPLKQAILLFTRHLYDIRAIVDHKKTYEIPFTLSHLLASYKIIYV